MYVVQVLHRLLITLKTTPLLLLIHADAIYWEPWPKSSIKVHQSEDTGLLCYQKNRHSLSVDRIRTDLEMLVGLEKIFSFYGFAKRETDWSVPLRIGEHVWGRTCYNKWATVQSVVRICQQKDCLHRQNIWILKLCPVNVAKVQLWKRIPLKGSDLFLWNLYKMHFTLLRENGSNHISAAIILLDMTHQNNSGLQVAGYPSDSV